MSLLGGETSSVLRGGAVPQTAVRPVRVVFLPPLLDPYLGVGERGEVVLAQTLIPQRAIEALDEGVLDRMSGANEVERDALGVGPLIERLTHKLRPVVIDDVVGPAAHQEQGVERVHHARPGSERSTTSRGHSRVASSTSVQLR